MDIVRILSRAKVNLTLEVSARRGNGYHDIDSVVQIIDIADELTIEKLDRCALEVTGDAAAVPSGGENLVLRACDIFFEATGIRGGASITLLKRIPVQAGLGGGSSNAAATIAGLDRLYSTGLPVEELGLLAARVGSDAPLFFHGGTVRMRGRGEQVEPLPDAPELSLVVVKPSVGVSTAWAYGELDRRPGRERRPASDACEQAVRAGNRDGLIKSMWNDFQPVVAEAVGEVGEAERALADIGAEKVVLAGSGSAVFGVFGSRGDAESAARSLRERFPRVFATRTVARRES